MRQLTSGAIEAAVQKLADLQTLVDEYRQLTDGRFLIDDWDVRARLEVLQEMNEVKDFEVALRAIIDSGHTPSREAGMGDGLTEGLDDELRDDLRDLGLYIEEEEE